MSVMIMKPNLSMTNRPNEREVKVTLESHGGTSPSNERETGELLLETRWKIIWPTQDYIIEERSMHDSRVKMSVGGQPSKKERKRARKLDSHYKTTSHAIKIK